MPKPVKNSPYQLETANLEWPQSDTPEATRFGDIYFSKHDGLAESQFVFLANNHLEERWQQLSGHQLFTVGETGFGTGLNFLCAWQLWRKTAPSNAHTRLHFISVEKYPLTYNDLEKALSHWPQLSEQSKQLLDVYPTLTPGHHVLTFDNGDVTLHLLLGDAIDGLEQLRHSNHPEHTDRSPHSIDAWFLDGFAPSKNPSLWNDTLYSLIADLSNANTTFATFTAVGNVRRGLIAQGFTVEKVPGYGSKREMLRGGFNSDNRQTKPTETLDRKEIKTPWYINYHAEKTSATQRVAVIGGGLAGATTAYALARRGHKVTLIERAEKLAQGASGNPQGMLFTKLSPEAGKLNQFTLSSYMYALRFYKQWQQRNSMGTSAIDFCGLLQLALTEKDRQQLLQLEKAFADHSELVQFVNAEQASDIAGIPINYAGLLLRQSGWLSPIVLCESLTQHPNIDIIYNHDIFDFTRKDQQWHVINKNRELVLAADVVVIANSRDAIQFKACEKLPIKTIRGQITQLPSSTITQPLKTVICHEGYATPAINDQHSLGATFSLGESDTDIRSDDHYRNLTSLNNAVPALFSDSLDSINLDKLPGRASLRCNSTDYLPIVGPIHNYNEFIEDYAQLRKDALTNIPNAGSYYPNLYINIAHGSRGITSTPLCSELLAAMICAEPLPLPRHLTTALNPARFVIRDLIRNRC